MRGHTNWVNGVAHLPDGRRIITCSVDGSLRLWDLKSGAQIGEDWRDGYPEVWSMALSPNGEIVASGVDNLQRDRRAVVALGENYKPAQESQKRWGLKAIDFGIHNRNKWDFDGGSKGSGALEGNEMCQDQSRSKIQSRDTDEGG